MADRCIEVKCRIFKYRNASRRRHVLNTYSTQAKSIDRQGFNLLFIVYRNLLKSLLIGIKIYSIYQQL